MTYIVLKDTFGDGLDTVDRFDLDVLGDTEQLDDAIIAAVEEIEESGFNEELSFEGVVVCKILEEINGVAVSEYVRRVYAADRNKQKGDRYKLYQELKAEFEP